MYTPINSFKSKNINIQTLVNLHIAVGQNIWSDQDFVIKETSKYYGVFPKTKKNEKVGTIHKNGTDFEFPRVALNKTDRQTLKANGLIIKNTYSDKPIPQVKISGLTTQKIRTHKAILERCIEASMRRHSKF